MSEVKHTDRNHPAPVTSESAPEAAYPSWEERPRNRSRRRFLSQVSSIAGGAGLLSSIGLPQLAHGQSRPVDFSMLEHHASPSTLAPQPPSEARAREQAAEERAEEESESVRADAPDEPSRHSEPLAELSETAAEPPGPQVTENRALWVEPGYLILVRITRAEGNSDAITAFEGSTGAVSVYLQGAIAETSQLHNVDLLHSHEVVLATLVQERIAPAVLEVLHIDHDCTTICSGLDPGHPPEIIPLRGEMEPVEWE